MRQLPDGVPHRPAIILVRPAWKNGIVGRNVESELVVIEHVAEMNDEVGVIGEQVGADQRGKGSVALVRVVEVYANVSVRDHREAKLGPRQTLGERLAVIQNAQLLCLTIDDLVF